MGKFFRNWRARQDLVITPVLTPDRRVEYHASSIVSAMVRGGIVVLDEGNRMRGLVDDVATPMTLGRYHDLLPPDVRAAVCLQLLDPDWLARWLASRDLHSSEFTSEAEGHLRDALGWRAGSSPLSA
jgi:hypothetical protein